MRFSADQQTLAYHLRARPLTVAMDLGDLPASVVGMAAGEFQKKNPMAQPEQEALWFYLGNHILAEIRKRRTLHEPLSVPEMEALRKVYRVNNKVFLRMFFYTTLICVREARHLQNAKDIMSEAKTLGLGAGLSFITKVNDNADTVVAQFVSKVPEALTMRELAKSLSFAFHKGKWASNYGGPAWGTVADALVHLIDGKYTPEVFCDVAFALAHNNGPIFNKGQMYHMYTPLFIEILDVQRSGQIPKYIMSENSNHVTEPMKKAVSEVQFLGDDFTGDVSWVSVIKLGAVGHYSHKMKAEEIAAAKKQQEIAEAAQKAILDKLSKYKVATVEVWHGQTVEVVTREALLLPEFGGPGNWTDKFHGLMADVAAEMDKAS